MKIWVPRRSASKPTYVSTLYEQRTSDNVDGLVDWIMYVPTQGLGAGS
jgi:hypothetical protein